MHELKLNSDDIKEVVNKETDTISNRIEENKLYDDFSEL